MSGSLVSRACASLALTVAVLVLLAGRAAAARAQPLAVTSFTATTSTAQAGAHPDLTVAMGFNTTTDSYGETVSADQVRDVSVSLPAGLLGDPHAVPECDGAQLPTSTSCPAATQVGVLELTDWTFGGGTGAQPPAYYPVYNMVPNAGEPARLGAVPFGFPTFFDIASGSGTGYRVVTTSSNILSTAYIWGLSLALWGVPADPSHDGERGSCLGVFGPSGSSCPSDLPAAPYLSNPTSCPSAPTVSLTADSWTGNTATATSTMPAITGCDRLPFDPTLTVRPTTAVADSPSGVDADLTLPQNQAPDGLREADLKDATVTLPVGASLSPTVADGLRGCTAKQIALDSSAPARCPLASQIGTVTLTTPLLPSPLAGEIYLGTPECSPCTTADAQDGKMAHGYIQAQGEGVVIKLPGSFTLDPTTGQITAHFLNNPQLPFSDLQLQFKGGPRGVLATPDACGTYTTDGDLSPWSSPFEPDALVSDTFQITSGCVSGFKPSFVAGSVNAQAGAFTPFVLSFQRSDTDQYLSGLRLTLPEGLLAELAGVPLCSDADANTGTCPASSRVGNVEVGAGPGSHPFFLPGKAYLTGPYKGAPYGLAVVVPVLAGPFNLGTVVVRQALYVNSRTVQITDVSDPLPQIRDGIPLRLRRVDVVLSRHGFTLNPTSCDVMSVQGTLTSTGGIKAPVASRFQVGGCAALPFSPKLKIGLSGKGRTRSGDHPTLTATLTQPARQANLRSAKVTLPLSLALDPKNSQHVCPYEVAKKVTTGPVLCPKDSLIGHSTAVTPLLSKPVSGNVYLVQGIKIVHGHKEHTLPTLLVALRGQIAIDLRANTEVNPHSQLVNIFPGIPDAPVSKFTLTINGGNRGILVITGRGRTICAKPQVSRATLGAQSGKREVLSLEMRTPCGAAVTARGRNR